MDIHITRKGEKFGPYPEAVARQYLEEGTLAVTDLAWHAGADGWKPLGEVLGIATQVPPEPQPPPEPTPPPTPAAGPPPATPASSDPPATPATSGPPPATPAGDSETAAGDADEIFITRKGQQIGPAPRTKAMELFTAGKLVPTDWGWHDGMDEWKPLYEVLGMEVPAQPAMTSAFPTQTVSAAPVKSRAMFSATGKSVALVFLYLFGALVITVGLVFGSEQVGAKTQASIGLVLTFLGYLVSISAMIWFWGVAYGINKGWFVLCFCLCPAQLVFLIMYWREAHRPFLLNLIGGFVAGAGHAMIDSAANR
jgi:hypothetical protein